jgi:hypothetical protein
MTAATDLIALAERVELLGLSDEWQAGPNMSEAVLAGLGRAREAGLVERQFGDMGKAATTAEHGGIRIRLSACWWFRLTEAGLRARATLAEGGSNAA